MKLTSIKRIFLFEKAVRKSKIKAHYVILLYTVFLGEPCTLAAITRQLQKVDRKWGSNIIQARIEYLLSTNTIEKTNKLYSLTPAGLLILKGMEGRLRKERHDK